MLTTTLSGTARDIIRFIRDGVHLLGIGSTETPWDVEGSPPQPPINLAALPELVRFVPIKRIIPVVEHEAGDIVLNDDSRWVGFEYFSEEVLLAAACSTVLFEADIPYSAIPPTVLTYRSVGLYVGCQVQDEINAATVSLDPTRVHGFLDTVWYFPPVELSPSLTHTVQLLRRF